MRQIFRFLLDRPNTVFLIAIVMVAISYGVPRAILFQEGASRSVSAKRLNLSASGGFSSALERARSLEAVYRASPSQDGAKQFAEALLWAGQYRELGELLRTSDALLLADQTRIIFKAETDLRLKNFVGAMEGVSVLLASAPRHPEASYLKARAQYALGNTDQAGVLKTLQPAIQGGGSISAAAWLFRARMALDDSDLDYVEAAINRAADMGASALALDALRLEQLFRQGSIKEFREKLENRRKNLVLRKYGIDVEGERLAAMLDLFDGDAISATIRLDLISGWLKHEIRGPLLLAVAKYESGVVQQSRQLFTDYLAHAPGDWVAADLYSEYWDDRKNEPASGSETGIIRQLKGANDAGAFDLVVDYLSQLSAQDVSSLRMISGRQVVTGYGDQKRDTDRSSLIEFIKLQSALGAQLRASNSNLQFPDGGAPPLKWYFHGRIYETTGDIDGAVDAYERSISADSGFFAPVRQLASIFMERGAVVAAEDVIATYLRANSERIDARVWFAQILHKKNKQDAALAILGTIELDDLFDNISAVNFYSSLLEPNSPAFITLVKNAKQRIPSSKTLGGILTKAGDFHGAARAFLVSIAADASDLDARSGYLASMTALNRRSQAKMVLENIDKRKGFASDTERKSVNSGIER